MPQQFIIKGNVFHSDNQGGLVQGTVQVFDNDLPSLNRQPELLGESPLDANGRFSITYTDDQFNAEESNRIYKGPREKKPDLSFKVFDTHQNELAIKSMKLPGQAGELGRDDLVFNSSPDQEITIYVEGNLIVAGKSEYEKLIVAITPTIEDVPLAQLTDKDMLFLLKDTPKETAILIPQWQTKMEWLRRSAILAEESKLPIEAFYGWGRKETPARYEELVTLPLQQLPEVLHQLFSLTDERLRSSLKKAIEEKIIPVGFDRRIDEIIKKLKRREQVIRMVVVQLQDEDTKAALANYQVTTYDIDSGNENRGLDMTDRNGKFSFDFYANRDWAADAPDRQFSFRIITPEGKLLEQGEPIKINSNLPENKLIIVRVKIRGDDLPVLHEQLQLAAIGDTNQLIQWFGAKNIKSFADIRRKGGISKIEDVRQFDAEVIRKVAALADLDRISPDIKKTRILLDNNFDSVLAISDAPYSEFIGRVGADGTEITTLDAAKLHVTATVQTILLNNILAGMAANIANGFNLPGIQGDQTEDI